ncbi:GDNF family receptor alpha-3 [Polypterus senegalus]|uniref:GDNF family receptor alpha-3 n=1 Tax=Polypterus senegalus TaxID=55291 RepID=UPI001962968D|nr:GDNF family receptor alpha-3 [Polypterus senegalus]
MIFLGLLLPALLGGSTQASHGGPPLDCVDAERLCLLDHQCNSSYRVLEYCAIEEAMSLLGWDARKECVTAENELERSPLSGCKCHRGSKKEEQCLKVYWTSRFSHRYHELDISPYVEMDTEPTWNGDGFRLAGILSGSSVPTDVENQCLEAAQACGLYEKCGNLRSEYVLACTKRAPNSDTCNRQKCHKALRRFLDRVPEEYAFGVLFCQCNNTLCGERRRKTIVPSCSYEEREKPNCMTLQHMCMKDDLCRSRLVDFQHNCQPLSMSRTTCPRDNAMACLRSYVGLIGTIVTPNYVSNNGTEVAYWCTCEASGNQRQHCEKILTMFNQNSCLQNAIKVLNSGAHHTLEGTQTSARSSQHFQQDDMNVLPGIVEVKHVDVVSGGGGRVEVNQPISEKAIVSNSQSGATGFGQSAALLLLALLPPLL